MEGRQVLENEVDELVWQCEYVGHVCDLVNTDAVVWL